MENPYKGLASYKEYNSSSFYGRDDDIQRFFTLVISHVLTVLTGKSGLGKTSLLQAGIYHKLRDKNILPVPVRIDLQATPDQFIINIHQALIAHIDKINHAEEGMNLTLLLRDRVIEIHSGQLVENNGNAPFPDDVQEDEWLSGSLKDYFNEIMIKDQSGTRWKPCLIFDQFEEIFTAHTPPALLQHIQHELINLLEEDANGSSIQDLQEIPGSDQFFKAIISLREDYFAQLTQYLKGIHFRKHAYYRIMPLNGEQAEEIITGPGVFDAKTRKRIIQFFFDSQYPQSNNSILLKDLEIEPTILSLLCTQTFDIIYSKSAEDQRIPLIQDISEKELNQRRIIEEYFTRLLSGFSAEAQAFIEDHLITKGGSRTPFRLDSNLSFKEDLDKMEKKRLIKKIWIGGKEHIELIHDVVAPLIKDNRDHRRDEMDKRALEEKLVKEREQRERIQIQQSWTLFVSVTAMIVFTILLILMFKAKEVANEERLIAEEAKSFADEQALLAEIARDSAELRRTQAEIALMIAEEQRNEAVNARQAETEAKNTALTQEEIARRRKQIADELAYMEKKATIQYQILNKETYAQQLFSQSESMAKGSINEVNPELNTASALNSLFTILLAIHNKNQVDWIDSVYQFHILPKIESSYVSDSSRFQALQDFQDRYREYLLIDEDYGTNEEFMQSAQSMIYREYTYVFDALLKAFVSNTDKHNTAAMPLDLSLKDPDEVRVIQKISPSFYLRLFNSNYKIEDIYITGMAFGHDNQALTASAGRVLIKKGDGFIPVEYENAGNSIITMGFLSPHQLIMGKIRTNTRIVSLDENGTVEELLLHDKGNTISYVYQDNQLFTLDENGGLWQWDLSLYNVNGEIESVNKEILDFGSEITCMAFNTTLQKWAFGSVNGDVFFIDQGQEYSINKDFPVPVYHIYENKSITDLVFSASGDWMATATAGSVDIWPMPFNNKIPEGLQVYQCDGCEIGGMTFDINNQYLLFGKGLQLFSRPVDLFFMAETLK